MKKLIILILIISIFSPIYSQTNWLLTGNGYAQGSQQGNFLLLGTTEYWSNGIHIVSGGNRVMSIAEPSYQPTEGQAIIVNPGNDHQSIYTSYGAGVTVNNAHLNLVGDAGWSNQIRFYRKGFGGITGIRHLITDDGTNLLIQPADILKIAGRTVIGNVTAPAGYRLYVESGILTEKVKIAFKNDAVNWADYVFEKNYNLKSLNDVEKFINENKHLPDVPSAEQVKKEGIDVAEMDATLLRKIEELTLYMIEMNKKIENLEIENQNLKQQVKIVNKH